MTTPLPTRSTRFTPEQREILGQVYTLILNWRREQKNMQSNSQAGQHTPGMPEAMPASLPQQDGGSNG